MNARLLCTFCLLASGTMRISAASPNTPTPYDVVTSYVWELGDSFHKQTILHPNGWGELSNLGRGGMWRLNPELGSVEFDEIGEKPSQSVHYQFWFYDNYNKFVWMEYRFHHDGVGYRGAPIGGVKPVAFAPPAPAPTAAAPQPPPAAPPSQIQILRDEGPNITAWVTSPLETGIPDAVSENLLFMRESLRDEQAAKPASDTAAYGAYSAALRYVSALIRDMEKRKQYEAAAGGDAVLHPSSNLTQKVRDHLTWPQYALERAEVHERHQQAAYARPFIASKGPERWEAEDQRMRQELTGLYVEFREYLREVGKR